MITLGVIFFILGLIYGGIQSHYDDQAAKNRREYWRARGPS